MEVPYYIGKSDVSMLRRITAHDHPGRTFWRHRTTTCSLWIPVRSSIDDFERALILASRRTANISRPSPRRYVYWEEPVLIDIRRPGNVLDCPGVYAIMDGGWYEQPHMAAMEGFHSVMGSLGLQERRRFDG